jgi:hypothetical protein
MYHKATNIKETHSTMTASLYLQERFLLGHNEESDLKWYVPLTWTTKSQAPGGFENTSPSQWLLPNETSKELPNINPDEWIIFNNQETGMFYGLEALRNSSRMHKLLQ